MAHCSGGGQSKGKGRCKRKDKGHLEDTLTFQWEPDGDAHEIASMQSTHSGAWSQIDIFDEPTAFNVGVHLHMGCSCKVLCTEQGLSTEPVSIGHPVGIVKRKLDVSEASIDLVAGHACFDQSRIYNQSFNHSRPSLKPKSVSIQATVGELNVDVIVAAEEY